MTLKKLKFNNWQLLILWEIKSTGNKSQGDNFLLKGSQNVLPSTKFLLSHKPEILTMKKLIKIEINFASFAVLKIYMSRVWWTKMKK